MKIIKITFIIFLITISFYFFIAFTSEKYVPLGPQALPPITPTTVVFAFDLHNVIVSPTFGQIIKYMWSYVPKKLIYELMSQPMVLYKLMCLSSEIVVSEGAYNKLSDTYPVLLKLKPFLLDLMNLQKLDHSMELLLEKLQQQGYSLYILSNIWPSALHKLHEQFPSIKTLFKGFYIPSAENNYVHKPQFVFYQKFKEYLKDQGEDHKHVIFIDNSLENIQAARQQGIYGIKFQEATKLIKQFCDNKCVMSLCN